MRLVLVYLRIGIIVFTFSCVRHSDWARIARWDEFKMDSLEVPAEFLKSAAIILLDKGDVDVIGGESISYTEYTHHRIYKINEEGGYGYANVTIPFNDYSEITSLEARTISPQGKITVLDADKIFDITLYPRYIFFSDQRAKIFTFPAVEKKCLLEYRYKMTMKNQTLIHSWNFQDYLPTMISKFSLRIPSEWELDYKLYNTDIELQVEKTPDIFKSRYHWQGKFLPAIAPEIATPSIRQFAAHLVFAPLGFNSWKDVAQWYHELSDPQMRATEKIQELALALTADLPDQKDKIQVIFEWVRDQIRYIAVEIGIGGFKPHSAEEVLINRYGDCKDMTTLVCALSRAVGIEMNQVLISTQPNGLVDTSLCSPFQFNHVIAYCPQMAERGLWLDATKKGNPFGSIPWYNQNLLAFVIDKQGHGSFKKTEVEAPEANYHRLEWVIELDSTLKTYLRGKSEFAGAIASEIRQDLFYSSQRERRQWLESYLDQRSSLMQLDSFTISGLSPVTDPLLIEYQGQSSSLLSQENKLMFLKPATILKTELPEIFYLKERRNPLQFRFGFLKECKVSFHLPPGWQLISSKKWNLINSDFGYYSFNLSFSENRLDYQGTFLMESKNIKASQYPKFKSFLDEIRENEEQIIFLTRSESE